MLRAPRDRVWHAISQAKQFGTWFGVEFDGEFAAGTRLTGRIAPTKVDAEVAKLQPTTLVEFRLEEVATGTQLTISESGFDRIPLERRAKAFTSNEAGWTHQSRLIAKYLDQPFS